MSFALTPCRAANHGAFSRVPVCENGEAKVIIVHKATLPMTVWSYNEKGAPVAAEFNLIRQGQETDPLGASEKVQKGGAGGGAEELMSFACIMQSAQRMVPQGEGKTHLDSPGREETKGHSDQRNVARRGGDFAVDPENIPGAGEGKAKKTDQSLPVKGTGLAESPHKATLKGEAAKGTSFFVNASRGDKEAKGLKPSVHVSEGGEAVKGSNPLMTVSRGKGIQTGGPSPGTSAVLPKKGGHRQIAVGREDLPEDGVPKGGKAERVRSLIGAEPGRLKPALQKTGLQAGAPESGTAAMAFGKEEIQSKSRGARVAAPAGEHIRNEKGVAAAFRNGGIKESESGENFRVAEGAPGPLKSGLMKAAAVKGKDAVFQNEENGAGKNSHVAEDAPEPLKSALKNAAAVKGKGVTERASYPPAPAGGKNDIGNQPGLKGETTAVGYEKTGGKNTRDHTAGVLHREGSQSASLSEKNVPVGGYQHTALHAGGRPAAVPENVGIPLRALIDQVAGGAKMSGRVRIALNPPSLGTLDVDVLVRGNKVHVILQAENSDVKQMLQSNMESLKGSLRNQGLVADTIQVFAQEKSNGDTYGSGWNEAFFGESSNKGRNDRDRGSGNVVSSHVSSLPEEETPRVRSDGRISVFA